MSVIKPMHPPKKTIQYARSLGWRYDNDFRLFHRKVDGKAEERTYQELLETDLNDYFMNSQEKLLSEDDLGISVQDLELASRHKIRVRRQAEKAVRLHPVTLLRIAEPIDPQYVPSLDLKTRKL